MKTTPIQLITTNLPRVLRQRIDRSFTLKFEGSLNEELEGPITLTIVVSKEWFAGFWSTMPCVVDYLKNWYVFIVFLLR